MKRCLALTLLLLATGCATGGGAPTVSAPPPQPGELDRATHWVRNSAEYEALVLQAFNIASERVRQEVAERQQGTWAVAVDADETIIDNTDYEKELALAGIETTDELWDGWVARRAAPPLPGAVRFLELVHSLGGRVTVVTNRIEQHCPDTRANFRAFDIPFDLILCRTDSSSKEARWQSIEAGTASPDLPPLEIVLWMGDNIHDFPGLDQGFRRVPGAAAKEFGDRFIAMPNPIYGSWTDNPKN